MAYWTTDEAVQEFLKKYTDLKLAIQRAQTLKLTSKTKKRSEFWRAVELALKELKPAKQLKTRYKEE
ncbi:hypothetical protein CF134_21580 [Aeromonas salmonicida]|uniref:Uncharacterized protein n=1 Tax=Aeromonas salmonicida subsp. pectinolytica 34mel TaxID=1324960 RepID=T0QT48_AERSA|nr:hypothetical protein [Aeromonas salmonicida]ATP09879.1 uncharacterized protein Asalp_27480 [Aeromonas salmonicida subsp. pectinolytica 34mel]EQC02393.1 hypothetical protein K931_20777 [Aeromonas salmonicida subsp. pectinolytica 34mel]TNI09520.1 hypothetical protein CF134_21580 [Aeromonas salmonicida]